MSSVVLIIEDELITADSIVRLLKDEDYTVLGPARSAEDALTMCAYSNLVPDVVLCDIHLKGNVKGTEVALTLKQRYGCEIVFLTAFSDQRTLTDAFRSDPAMYVVKPFTDKQLLVAVQLAFHRVFSKQAPVKTTDILLTKKESEILGLIAHGLTTKQIASKLNISTETVKTHRKRMLRKNNATTIPWLVYKFGAIE